MSVTTNIEGTSDRKIAGRGASERQVIVRLVVENDLDGGAIGVQRPVEASSGAEDDGSASTDVAVGGGRAIAEGGVLDEYGAAEGAEDGVGEIDDDDFGGDEEAMELLDGHRLRAGAAALGFEG
jgi:hypothetical protein